MQRSPPGSITDLPHVQGTKGSNASLPSTALQPPAEQDLLQDTPAAFRSEMAGPSQQTSSLLEDLRSILQALPTKADIEALVSRIEEAHSHDIQEVKEEVQSLAIRVETGETSVTSLEHRMSALENAQATQMATAVDLQLHLEDLEDRSRRNNLRLWGLPEATGTGGHSGDSGGHLP